MKFTMNSKEFMRLVGIVDFVSRDSLTLKNRKASTDSAIYAVLIAKKDKIIIKSASENVFYIKTSGSATVAKKGKCTIDISAFSGFNLKAKDVTVEDTGDKLKVNCGRLKSILDIKSDITEIEDSLPDKEPDTDISLPIAGLSDAKNHVIFSSHDSEIEYSLPFSLITTKKGSVYACSNDHYCTSIHKIKDFKGKLKLKEMRTIPESILDRIIRSTLDKEISFGFGSESFTLKTNDITLTYPQPEYDALADVVEAMKDWRNKKSSLTFEVNPADLSDKIEEVGSVRDDDDAKIDLKIKDKKLILNLSGALGEAKSYVNVKNISGKKNDLSVVYGVFSSFVSHISALVEEKCTITTIQNLVLVETLDKNTCFTFTAIADDYEEE